MRLGLLRLVFSSHQKMVSKTWHLLLNKDLVITFVLQSHPNLINKWLNLRSYPVQQCIQISPA